MATVDVRDLPFSISRLPDVFTPFRKAVEGATRKLGREPLVMPTTFKPFPAPRGPSANPSYGKEFDNCTAAELIPYLLEPIKGDYDPAASAPDYKRDERSAFAYSGGETSALARLDWYFHQGSPPPVARYKETRNGLLGADYSTKFSPFLCLGMLSPRLIMQSLDKHEAIHGESDNTYWVRLLSCSCHCTVTDSSTTSGSIRIAMARLLQLHYAKVQDQVIHARRFRRGVGSTSGKVKVAGLVACA